MHIAYPIIYGVTKPTYSDDELEEMKANSKKEYEWQGKKLDGYECTQKQRWYETEIRKGIDRENALKAAGDETGYRIEALKTSKLRMEYKAFSQHVGLSEKLNRTGYGSGVPGNKQKQKTLPVTSLSNSNTSEKMNKGKERTTGIFPGPQEIISEDDYNMLFEKAKANGIDLRNFEKFDGDLSLVNDAIDEIKEVLDDFNIDTKDSGRVTLQLSYNMDDADYAVTTVRTIQLNGRAMRSRQILHDDYAGSDFFVPGTDEKSIIYHEMGHLITNIKYKDFGLKYDKMEEIIRAIGIGSIEKISECGSASYSEAVAELFSAYYSPTNDKNLLIFAEKCVNLLKKKGGSKHDKRY